MAEPLCATTKFTMKQYLNIKKKSELIYIFTCILICCCNNIRNDIIKRQQDPKKPYPYHEEEVFYTNENAEIKFAGTLTTPKSKGPFPALILITGQGPQDRDETILGHRPFLILSDYLTRRGFAVLRSDDRGVGKSEGHYQGSSTKDFSTDTRAAFEFLKVREDINPRKIGLIGHSEGGLIASLVAAEKQEVAFIVMMATPVLSGEEIMYQQFHDVAKAHGAGEHLIMKQKQFLNQMMEILKTKQDSNITRKKLLITYEQFLSEMSSDESAIWREAYNFSEPDNFVNKFTDPWTHNILLFDPLPTLMNVKCPILFLFGGKDVQVAAIHNSALIENAFRKSGKQNFQIEVFPTLNHLFQTAVTGSPKEYANIKETISPIILDTINNWIVKQIDYKQNSK
jgi:pimeloyl-ACP methyl ester carboxylesterase